MSSVQKQTVSHAMKTDTGVAGRSKADCVGMTTRSYPMRKAPKMSHARRVDELGLVTMFAQM